QTRHRPDTPRWHRQISARLPARYSLSLPWNSVLVFLIFSAGMQVFLQFRYIHPRYAHLGEVSTHTPPVFLVDDVINGDDGIDNRCSNTIGLPDETPGNQSVGRIFCKVSALDVVRAGNRR